MFSLNFPTEPYWIDLPDGVRVKIRPIDGVTLATIRQFSIGVVRDTRKAIEAAAGASVPAGFLPDLDDPAVYQAHIEVAMARGLARYAMLAWEGVGESEDSPLAFTPTNAERLATHPRIMPVFLQKAFEPAQRVADEGNASGSALIGSTAAGPITAADAEHPATPVLLN